MWINGKLKELRDAAKEENRILCDRSMRIQTNPEPSKTIYPQTNKHKLCIQLHPNLYFTLKRQKTKKQRRRGEWSENREAGKAVAMWKCQGGLLTKFKLLE